jgi:hypothetical protein
MRALAFQVAELRFLVRGLKAYARRRTPRVRRWFGLVIRYSNPSVVAGRRQLVGTLPKADSSIPEATGVLELTAIVPDLLGPAVGEASALLDASDIDGLRSREPDRHLYTLPLGGRLEPDSAVLRLALAPQVLRTVSDYLGTLPVIENIMLWYSPNERNVDGTSQFHHLDGQDVRTLQLFVALEDVSDDNGPLTAVSAAVSERIARVVAYRKNEVTKRIPDDIVSRYASDQADFHVLAGPRGSAWLVDTDRCFHFGSRAGTRPRRMLVIQYYSPFAFVLPRRWSGALPLAARARELARSDVERQVLGAA